MLITIPAYIKEFKNTFKDLMNMPVPENEKNLIPEGYHIKASFFKDTFLEPLLKIPVIGKKLYDFDKSLFDFKMIYNSKSNKGILPKIGVTKEIFIYSKIISKINKEFIQAYKLEGNKFGCFIGHVLMNISKINLLVISLLQMPIIYKAFADKDSKENKLVHGIKQIFKSAITIPLAVLGGAVLGTLFHRKGAASSFLATGVGAYMGVKTGEYLEEKIDKLKIFS